MLCWIDVKLDAIALVFCCWQHCSWVSIPQSTYVHKLHSKKLNCWIDVIFGQFCVQLVLAGRWFGTLNSNKIQRGYISWYWGYIPGFCSKITNKSQLCLNIWNTIPARFRYSTGCSSFLIYVLSNCNPMGFVDIGMYGGTKHHNMQKLQRHKICHFLHIACCHDLSWC